MDITPNSSVPLRLVTRLVGLCALAASCGSDNSNAYIQDQCDAECQLAAMDCSAYFANCADTCPKQASKLSPDCRAAMARKFGCAYTDPGRQVRICSADAFDVTTTACGDEETAVDANCP